MVPWPLRKYVGGNDINHMYRKYHEVN